MNGIERMDAVYVWVIKDLDDTEGIAGFVGEFGWVPLVSHDKQKMATGFPHELVESIVIQKGVEARLLEFSHREEITTVLPGGGHASRGEDVSPE